MIKTCISINAGRVPYLESLQTQKLLHSKVVEGNLPEILLLLEHEPVYTLGRRGTEKDILVPANQLSDMGIEVHRTDRGGQATYHGPGQLVGYPIINLRSLDLSPLRYIRNLEKVISVTLSDFGIKTSQEKRSTGVWVDNAKIAAIGVKVSQGVTYHGFALNIDPNLSYFKHIIPCGMPNVEVTSMSAQLGQGNNLHSVIPAIATNFARIFQMKLKWSNLQEL